MINLNGIGLKQAIRNLAACFILVVIFLTGCNGNKILDTIFLSEKATPDKSVTQEPLQEKGLVTTAAPTENLISSNHFTIWLPPQFDPNVDTESGKIMRGQIELFQELYPQYIFDIRIKADGGSDSMVNTMLNTSIVAPEVLPSVVLISQSDLEIAATQGIILPIKSPSSIADESDWFPFTNEMGIINGETYGLPFVADAVGLVTHEDVFGSEYVSLIEASKKLDTIAFAAGDPDGMVPFILYQSIGGNIEDTQGKPIIELEYLSSTLASIEEATRLGVFSTDLVDYLSDDQVWSSFSENEFKGILTWVSHSLAEADKYFISPLPGIGDQPYTYGSGWVWCLVNKKNTNQELSTAFIEHMIDPKFLSEWTPKTKYLPVRPSSITGWDESFRATIANILYSADLMPNKQVLSFAKSDIINAVQDLLQGLSTSEESTRKVMDRLETAQAQ
ncbi:MAG: extracellular solute-binding protein [Anaerolineaceae bacterium]|nr:extracellular solute-binding protein [Anaerolineaceae bacterium]